MQFLREIDYIGTVRGVIATEFNEAHPILATELYMSGMLSVLGQDELCVVLAAFLETDKRSWRFRVPDGLTEGATDALKRLDQVAREATEHETGLRGVAADANYWLLSSKWPVIIDKYLVLLDNGTDVSSAVTVICAEHGIYEGNFVRAVLKLANMLDELQGVATYMKNIEILKALEGAGARLVSGLIVPDSLYLHM